MSPELAARIRAATAALADYQASAGSNPVCRVTLADRLARETGALLGAIVTEDMEAPAPVACGHCGAEIVPVDVTVNMWRHVRQRDLATDFLNEDHDAKPRRTS